MGLGHSPQIVTNGMVLCLDAANPKNYNLTEVEVLVVAGGGGGGGGHGGGGGGAGGLIYNQNFAVTVGYALTVTVGEGGNGGNAGTPGSDGSNSVFGSLTATGGGGGGGENSPRSGRSGGSGGGGSGFATASSGGTATSGQGFEGGGGGTPDTLGGSTYGHGGGGGGAAGAGTDGSEAVQPNGNVGTAGVGGSGLGINVSGTFTYYAGGGGGGYWGTNLNGGAGGLGGGGRGGDGGSQGQNGTTNTGGGGGGSPGAPISEARTGGTGGSGIAIVRYPGLQKAKGGTITSNNGYTIHTFTTSGTFTPLVATNNSAILGLSDLSGNGNFGTTENSPTYSSANGGSVSFDSVNDHIITTGMQNFSYTNGITVSVWHYNGGGTGPYRGLVTNGISGDRSGGFDLRYGRENYFGGTNNGTSLNWTITNSGGTSTLITINANVNEWHNYVGTYDNTTVRVYKDGQLFNSIAHSGGGQLKTMNGSTIIGLSPGTAEYLDGILSQVSIYNRALTQAEIQQNFNALRGRFGI